MSVDKGHGEGSQKQFIDTIGGYDQTSGHDGITFDVFYSTQHVVSAGTQAGTVYWNTSLAKIVQETGNDIVKQFQFFKINRMTMYLKDLDYGQAWSYELQGYDFYMAPWLRELTDGLTAGERLRRIVPPIPWGRVYSARSKSKPAQLSLRMLRIR